MADWIDVSADWLTDLLGRTDKIEPAFAFASTVNFMRSLSILANRVVAAPEDYVKEVMGPTLKLIKPAWSPRHPDEALMGLVFEQLYRSADFANSLAIQAQHVPAERRSSSTSAAIATWYYAMYGLARALLLALYGNAPEVHAAVAETVCTHQTRRLLPEPFSVVATHSKGMECVLVPEGFPRDSRILNVTGPNSENDARAAIGAYFAGTWVFFAGPLVDKIKKKAGATRLTQKLQQIRDSRVRDAGFFHAAFRYRGKAHYRDGIYTSYGQAPAGGETFLEDAVRSYQHLALVIEAIVCQRVTLRWYEAYVKDLAGKQRDRAAVFPTRWQGPAILATMS